MKRFCNHIKFDRAAKVNVRDKSRKIEWETDQWLRKSSIYDKIFKAITTVEMAGVKRRMNVQLIELQ